ncbi:uncharacterized protein EI90DRAFT_3080014, partial [Cantharellus anzutake]|uniref:uncharacterized protein n=1 Tax=Cantharellus anzutake TaxID=1750568 RepID=UPI001905F25B
MWRLLGGFCCGRDTSPPPLSLRAPTPEPLPDRIPVKLRPQSHCRDRLNRNKWGLLR